MLANRPSKGAYRGPDGRNASIVGGGDAPPGIPELGGCLGARPGGTVTSHHLYVHVPFCRLVCAYCDFVTVGGRRAELPRYVDALLGEMSMRPASGELETVYFGGGTPSLLAASAVERVVQTARDRWRSVPVEVTLEANP